MVKWMVMMALAMSALDAHCDDRLTARIQGKLLSTTHAPHHITPAKFNIFTKHASRSEKVPYHSKPMTRTKRQVHSTDDSSDQELLRTRRCHSRDDNLRTKQTALLEEPPRRSPRTTHPPLYYSGSPASEHLTSTPQRQIETLKEYLRFIHNQDKKVHESMQTVLKNPAHDIHSHHTPYTSSNYGSTLNQWGQAKQSQVHQYSSDGFQDGSNHLGNTNSGKTANSYSNQAYLQQPQITDYSYSSHTNGPAFNSSVFPSWPDQTYYGYSTPSHDYLKYSYHQPYGQSTGYQQQSSHITGKEQIMPLLNKHNMMHPTTQTWLSVNQASDGEHAHKVPTSHTSNLRAHKRKEMISHEDNIKMNQKQFNAHLNSNVPTKFQDKTQYDHRTISRLGHEMPDTVGTHKFQKSAASNYPLSFQPEMASKWKGSRSDYKFTGDHREKNVSSINRGISPIHDLKHSKIHADLKHEESFAVPNSPLRNLQPALPEPNPYDDGFLSILPMPATPTTSAPSAYGPHLPWQSQIAHYAPSSLKEVTSAFTNYNNNNKPQRNPHDGPVLHPTPTATESIILKNNHNQNHGVQPSNDYISKSTLADPSYASQHSAKDMDLPISETTMRKNLSHIILNNSNTEQESTQRLVSSQVPENNTSLGFEHTVETEIPVRPELEDATSKTTQDEQIKKLPDNLHNSPTEPLIANQMENQKPKETSEFLANRKIPINISDDAANTKTDSMQLNQNQNFNEGNHTLADRIDIGLNREVTVDTKETPITIVDNNQSLTVQSEQPHSIENLQEHHVNMQAQLEQQNNGSNLSQLEALNNTMEADYDSPHKTGQNRSRDNQNHHEPGDRSPLIQEWKHTLSNPRHSEGSDTVVDEASAGNKTNEFSNHEPSLLRPLLKSSLIQHTLQEYSIQKPENISNKEYSTKNNNDYSKQLHNPSRANLTNEQINNSHLEVKLEVRPTNGLGLLIDGNNTKAVDNDEQTAHEKAQQELIRTEAKNFPIKYLRERISEMMSSPYRLVVDGAEQTKGKNPNMTSGDVQRTPHFQTSNVQGGHGDKDLNHKNLRISTWSRNWNQENSTEHQPLHGANASKNLKQSNVPRSMAEDFYNDELAKSAPETDSDEDDDNDEFDDDDQFNQKQPLDQWFPFLKQNRTEMGSKSNIDNSQNDESYNKKQSNRKKKLFAEAVNSEGVKSMLLTSHQERRHNEEEETENEKKIKTHQKEIDMEKNKKLLQNIEKEWKQGISELVREIVESQEVTSHPTPHLTKNIGTNDQIDYQGEERSEPNLVGISQHNGENELNLALPKKNTEQLTPQRHNDEKRSCSCSEHLNEIESREENQEFGTYVVGQPKPNEIEGIDDLRARIEAAQKGRLAHSPKFIQEINQQPAYEDKLVIKTPAAGCGCSQPRGDGGRALSTSSHRKHVCPCSCQEDVIRAEKSKTELNKYDIMHNMLLWMKHYLPNEPLAHVMH